LHSNWTTKPIEGGHRGHQRIRPIGLCY